MPFQVIKKKERKKGKDFKEYLLFQREKFWVFISEKKIYRTVIVQKYKKWIYNF